MITQTGIQILEYFGKTIRTPDNMVELENFKKIYFLKNMDVFGHFYLTIFLNSFKIF